MPTVSCTPGQLGDLQLRADAVGARNEHRIVIIPREQPLGEIELKQPGEPALVRQHARRMRPPQQPRQPGHRLLVDGQVDAGVFVGRFRHLKQIKGGGRKGEGGRRYLRSMPDRTAHALFPLNRSFLPKQGFYAAKLCGRMAPH